MERRRIPTTFKQVRIPLWSQLKNLSCSQQIKTINDFIIKDYPDVRPLPLLNQNKTLYHLFPPPSSHRFKNKPPLPLFNEMFLLTKMPDGKERNKKLAVLELGKHFEFWFSFKDGVDNEGIPRSRLGYFVLIPTVSFLYDNLFLMTRPSQDHNNSPYPRQVVNIELKGSRDILSHLNAGKIPISTKKIYVKFSSLGISEEMIKKSISAREELNQIYSNEEIKALTTVLASSDFQNWIKEMYPKFLYVFEKLPKQINFSKLIQLLHQPLPKIRQSRFAKIINWVFGFDFGKKALNSIRDILDYIFEETDTILKESLEKNSDFDKALAMLVNSFQEMYETGLQTVYKETNSD